MPQMSDSEAAPSSRSTGSDGIQRTAVGCGGIPEDTVANLEVPAADGGNNMVNEETEESRSGKTCNRSVPDGRGKGGMIPSQQMNGIMDCLIRKNERQLGSNKNPLPGLEAMHGSGDSVISGNELADLETSYRKLGDLENANNNDGEGRLENNFHEGNPSEQMSLGDSYDGIKVVGGLSSLQNGRSLGNGEDAPNSLAASKMQMGEFETIANHQSQECIDSQSQNCSTDQSQNCSTGQSQNCSTGQSQNCSTGQSQNNSTGQSQNCSTDQSQNSLTELSQNCSTEQSQNCNSDQSQNCSTGQSTNCNTDQSQNCSTGQSQNCSSSLTLSPHPKENNGRDQELQQECQQDVDREGTIATSNEPPEAQDEVDEDEEDASSCPSNDEATNTCARCHFIFSENHLRRKRTSCRSSQLDGGKSDRCQDFADELVVVRRRLTLNERITWMGEREFIQDSGIGDGRKDNNRSSSAADSKYLNNGKAGLVARQKLETTKSTRSGEDGGGRPSKMESYRGKQGVSGSRASKTVTPKLTDKLTVCTDASEMGSPESRHAAAGSYSNPAYSSFPSGGYFNHYSALQQQQLLASFLGFPSSAAAAAAAAQLLIQPAAAAAAVAAAASSAYGMYQLPANSPASGFQPFSMFGYPYGALYNPVSSSMLSALRAGKEGRSQTNNGNSSSTNPFNFPWMNEDRNGRSSSGTAVSSRPPSGGRRDNYDKHGALDLSAGNPLKRKREPDESGGSSANRKWLSSSQSNKGSPNKSNHLPTGSRPRSESGCDKSATPTRSSTVLGGTTGSSTKTATFSESSNVLSSISSSQQMAEFALQPPLFAPSAANLIARWTVDEVADFVADVDGCGRYAEVSRHECRFIFYNLHCT